MSHYMVQVENSLEKFVENICEMYKKYGVNVGQSVRIKMISARNRIDNFFDEGFYKVNEGYSIKALTRSLADKLEYLDLYETEMRRINRLADAHSLNAYDVREEFILNFRRFKQEVCEIFSKALGEKNKRKDDLQITSSMSEKEKAELIKKIPDERARVKALELLEDEWLKADILGDVKNEIIREEGIKKIESDEIRMDLALDFGHEFGKMARIAINMDFVNVLMAEGGTDNEREDALSEIESERLRARVIAGMSSGEIKLELSKKIKDTRNRDRIMDSIDEKYKKRLQEEIAEQREHIEEQEKEINELQIIQQRDSRGQYQPGD